MNQSSTARCSTVTGAGHRCRSQVLVTGAGHSYWSQLLVTATGEQVEQVIIGT